jgi:hypothetical protein
MEIYVQIIQSIIRHQEAIIGPVAVEQAEQIPHLHLEGDQHDATVDGDPIEVIDNLVHAYSELFGQISVEVSKEAAASLLVQLHPNGMPRTLA